MTNAQRPTHTGAPSARSRVRTAGAVVVVTVVLVLVGLDGERFQTCSAMWGVAAPTESETPAPTTTPSFGRNGLEPQAIQCSTDLRAPAAIGLLALLGLGLVMALDITRASGPGGLSIERSLDVAQLAVDTAQKASTAANEAAGAALALVSAKSSARSEATAHNSNVVILDRALGRANENDSIDDLTRRQAVVFGLSGLGAEIRESVATRWDDRQIGWRAQALFLQFDRERCVFREMLDDELVLDGDNSPGRDLWKLDIPAVVEAETVFRGNDASGQVVLVPVRSAEGETIGALGMIISGEPGLSVADVPDEFVELAVTTLLRHAPACAALIEMGRPGRGA